MTPSKRQGGPSRSGVRHLRAVASHANHWRQTRWFRLTGFIAGTLLIVLAITAALRQDPESIRRALHALGNHPWWFAVLFFTLPLLNWLTISISIWILLARFGRLGIGETLALVGMAWMLNYLPMRPGMVGRVAYHKTVNKIGVRQTGRTLVEGVVITGVVSGVMFLGVLGLHRAPPALAWSGVVLGPLLAGFAAAAVLWQSRPVIARYCAAGSLRVIDMAVWALRYALAFAIVGASIDLTTALVLAVASQIAMLVPISGNGLGVREWLIGALAASLPATAALGGAEPQLAQGLTADVLNRVVEVLVAVPLGLVSVALIGRRLRRLGKSRAPTTEGQDLP